VGRLGKERGGAHAVPQSGTPKRHWRALHRYRVEKSLKINDLQKWWSWRELNPRPQAFVEQIYMFSVLF